MSTKLQDVSKRMVAADKFTDKRVVDREGIEFGKVKHIHIDQDTLRVSGVTVRQRFNKDYFLPDKFIEKFTEKTLLLSTSPIRTSATVADIDGRKIGKVKSLHKNPDTGDLETLTISSGIFSSRTVSKTEICGVGEKIILKITKQEFEKLR